jgi:hypothetical protein
MFRQQGANAPALIDGLVGKALRFDGKRQYFESPAGTRGLDVGEGNLTVELWVRTTNPKETSNIVDKRDALPRGYLVFVHQGHPGFQVPYGEHSNVWPREVTIGDGRWHHLAGVARRLPPAPIRIFVDGVERASGSSAPLVNLDVTEPLWLGRHHRNGRVQRDDIYFQGDIDELAIYKRALTAPEIMAIYRAGSRGRCRPKK